MKFSLLCLLALGATSTSAFVLPTQRPAAALVSSATQLQVAAEPEVMNGVVKPRKTRQVRVELLREEG